MFENILAFLCTRTRSGWTSLHLPPQDQRHHRLAAVGPARDARVVYHVLKLLLRSKKIIVPAIRVSKIKSSKGGPRPTVWAIQGASKEEISTAVRLHYKMMSPKYRVAEEVAQTILDEYITSRNVWEISYREIVIVVKELKIPFRVPDVADLAASYLHEKGVKVWR